MLTYIYIVKFKCVNNTWSGRWICRLWTSRSCVWRVDCKSEQPQHITCLLYTSLSLLLALPWMSWDNKVSLFMKYWKCFFILIFHYLLIIKYKSYFIAPCLSYSYTTTWSLLHLKTLPLVHIHCWFWLIFEFYYSQTRPLVIMAVSYTHLDVYKRQI